MKLKRQVLYREVQPVDGQVIDIDLDTSEYDLLTGKASSTKFCWIEPVSGIKARFIDIMSAANTLTLYTVKGIFFGFGFAMGAVVLLETVGVL